jgi:uncharacterized protein (TIGR02217 family)
VPPPAFPALKGQGWSVIKRPMFSTRTIGHVSGREVRRAFYSFPIYEFELVYDGLDSAGRFAGLGANSLQSLMGLYLASQGSYGTFLYTDPTDSQAAAQVLGTGDGAKTVFTFQRTLGAAIEPVSYVTSVANVYLDAVDQPSGWTATAPRTLTFASPPGNGVVVSATFAYAFECRFLEDQVDFENFMSGLWKVESLKFRSVKS